VTTGTAWALTAAAVLVAVVYLRRQGEEEEGGLFFEGVDDGYMPDTADTMPDQLPGMFDSWIVSAEVAAQEMGDSVGITTAPDNNTAARNERAFLDMLAYSEGTSGPNGYRTLFGGTLFESFADHPRKFFSFTDKVGKTNRTSAAGRYQFLMRTWDELKASLKLPDFGPASQDRAALELIRRRGALADVRAGRIQMAITKCAPIWASLPGAGYNQPERKLSSLLNTFAQSGGIFESQA
jgi:lysozyme